MPEWAQVAIVVGVTAVAAFATFGAFAPEAAAIDAGTLAELGGTAATVGAANVADSSPEEIDQLTQAFTTGTATDAMTAAYSADDQVLAYERAVVTQGPKAIGAYGEEVFKGYLENLGLREGVDYMQQVSYTTTEGEVRFADFVINELGGVKDVAIDVKTGGPIGYNEAGTTSLSLEQLGDYLDNVDKGRFGQLMYVNVPIAGRCGFAPGLEGASDAYGFLLKTLPPTYGGMP